jgi:hypothetical protein
LEDQTGRIFQAITTPINTINADMVSIKNLAPIEIPFSLGKTKTSLTAVEEVLKDLASIVDNLTGIFGGGTNFRSKIDARKGSLLLSSHFITRGKVVIMNGSQLANDQRSVLSAKILWDLYHYINSFAEYQGEHNQFKRLQKKPVPMTLAEFATLLTENLATDSSGNIYEIEKVIFTPEMQKAIIDFRFKYKYTNNLKVEIVT